MTLAANFGDAALGIVSRNEGISREHATPQVVYPHTPDASVYAPLKTSNWRLSSDSARA